MKKYADDFRFTINTEVLKKFCGISTPLASSMRSWNGGCEHTNGKEIRQVIQVNEDDIRLFIRAS